MVDVGQQAPDFIAPALVDGRGESIDLVSRVQTADAVVLLFAPADFVPPITAEWRGVVDAGWHDHPQLAVVGITGDSLFSHAAFAKQEAIPFPIVSDFHASVATQYDFVADEWEGHKTIPKRGAVVIDGDWEVKAVERAPPLERVTPTPPAQVTDTLLKLGLDINRPSGSEDG